MRVKRVWMVVAVILLAAVSALAWLAYIEFAWLLQEPPPEGIEVTVQVENRTNQRVGPFTIVTSSSEVTAALPPVAPGETEAVQLVDRSAGGENSMSMVDATGRAYWLVGYFEWPLSGSIDVRVESVSPDGTIQGRLRTRISYPGPWRWYPLYEDE